MAATNILFGDDEAFVSWEFVCKTPAEKALQNRIAKQKLNYFLAGFNAGIVSLGKKKNVFVIENDRFKSLEKGSNKFLFEPKVSRKPKSGGVGLARIKVPKPSQPNP
ncbi:MAG TPA: hypothetical protein VFZ33_05720 [Chitinophagaceae bacterium]